MVKLVAVSVEKNESGKIGLSFVDTSDGSVVVKRISETSPFAGTALEPEMTIKTVNSIPVDGFNAMKIKSMLTSLPDTISLVCSKPTSRKSAALTATNIQAVTASKNAEGKTGIQIHDGTGVVLVKYIAEDSPFANTALQPDMAVLAINDIYCDGMDAKQVRSIFSVMPGPITLFVGNVPDATPGLDTGAAPVMGALPTFCTATASKSDQGKIGLAFTDQPDGTVKITTIKETSPFAETALKKGMVICTLNSVGCTGLDANQIKSIVAALPDEITMTAALLTPGSSSGPWQMPPSNVQAATVSQEKKANLGLELENNASTGAVTITGMTDDSPLQGSDLTKGMTLLSINNLTCDGMNVKQILAYIASLPHDVTLIAGQLAPKQAAKPKTKPPVELASATVQKNERGKIGLSFVDTKDGSVIITKISETSPFANTAIKTEMTLLTVNTVPVDGMDAGQIKTMLTSLPDTITLVAAVVNDKSKAMPAKNFQVVSADRDENGRVGIGMVSKFSDGSVIVTNIKEDSPFAKTTLQKGMVIYTLNDIPTHGMDAVQVRSLLRTVKEPVTLFAGSPDTTKTGATLPNVKIAHATVQKKENGKIGMSFADRSDGCVEITKISETSPFAETDIKPGMTILTVNGVACDGMNANRIKSTLGNLPDTITMVAAKVPETGFAARNVQVVALEEAPKDGETGLAFVEQQAGNGVVFVSEIDADSPFKSTELQKGMTILSINGLSCDGLDASQLKALFSSMSGPITLYAGMLGGAAAASSGGGGAPTELVSATVEKTAAGKIGLSFIDKSDGSVVITKVSDVSPFAGTDIAPDMMLKTINTVPVDGMDAAKIKSMLANLPSSITLVAAKANDSVASKTKNVQVATVNKKADGKVGISMIDKRSGAVVITKISDESPFAGTPIKKGMKIMAINNVSTAGMDSNQIRAIFKSVPDPITLFAGATAERTPSMIAASRPLFVSATVDKSETGKIGLVFLDQPDGSVQITSIKETSPFAPTAIKKGMTLVTLNSISCAGMDANRIKETLSSLPKSISLVAADLKGRTTGIGAQNVQSVTVEEKTLAAGDGTLGLEFFNGSNETVAIKEIAEDSPLANSGISSGMTVLSINNVSTEGMDVQQVESFVSSLTGSVTMIAGSTSGRAASMVTRSFSSKLAMQLAIATATKNESGKVGLSFVDRSDGSVTITKISDTSPFADSDLKKDMVVKTINKVPVDGMDANKIKSMLATLPDSITIIAARINAAASETAKKAKNVQYASASRNEAGKIGLSFVDKKDGAVVITKISDESPFANTDLQEDMTFLSVNGVSCEGMDAKQLRSMFKSVPDPIEIFASSASGGSAAAAMTLPTVVSASVEKSETGKVGLVFLDQEDGSVKITSIKETSPFAGTAIKTGMTLLTLNGVPTVGMHAGRIKTMLSSFPKEITMVAADLSKQPAGSGIPMKNAQVATYEESETAGLTLKQEANGTVTIEDIATESPLASSDVKKGMTLFSINNMSCSGMSVQQVQSILKSSSGSTAVLAGTLGKPKASAPPGKASMCKFVCATAEKNEKGKIGLSFVDKSDGSVVITKISDTSPFGTTDLQKDMVLKTVNTIAVDGMDSNQVKAIVGSMGNEITLVAARVAGSSPATKAKDVQVATANKTPEGKVGLAFIDARDGSVVITNVSESSPFAGTAMAKGMSILAVNDIPCEGLTATQIRSIFKSCPEPITVFAGVTPGNDPKPTKAPDAPGSTSSAKMEFAAATVEKAPNGKIGLSFVDKANGTVQITGVKDTSPFANTDISKGMTILTLNNIPCDGMTSARIKSVLDALPGSITMIAGTATEAVSNIQVISVEEVPKGKAGISFVERDAGYVAVAEIADDSPFQSTELKKGMSVLSVNDMACDVMDAKQLSSLIDSLPGSITMFAGRMSRRATSFVPSPAMTFVTATVEKNESGKVGLSFVDRADGTVVITKVSDTSPFAPTEIAKGMVIKTVNTIPCDGMEANRIRALFASLPGSITLVVAQPSAAAEAQSRSMVPASSTAIVPAGGAAGAVSAMSKARSIQVVTTDKNANGKVGLKLIDQTDGTVKITGITDDSPFASTPITPGMSVLSINNIPCDGMKASQVRSIFTSCPDPITLYAGKLSGAIVPKKMMLTCVSATAEKNSQGKVGVSFSDTAEGPVIITKIGESSPFAGTPIKKDMTIVTVNGISCDGMYANQINSLFASFTGPITIIAAQPVGPSNAVPFKEVHVVTAELGDKTGLTFAEGKEGSVVVDSVDDDSPFANSVVTPGVSILSINNMSCESMEKSQLEGLLGSVSGSVSLIVGTLESESGAVPGMAEGAVIGTKQTMQFAAATVARGTNGTGLTLMDLSDGSVIITEVEEDSPFYATAITEDMSIFTVNNISCDGLSARQVHAVFAQVPGTHYTVFAGTLTGVKTVVARNYSTPLYARLEI